MNKCILLTATIAPHNVPNLKRIDKEKREKDYYDAINYYLQFNIPIIFCENSNTKSDAIISLLENNNIEYEYLSFLSSKSKDGKGAGEAEIFKYAFQNSEIIKRSNHIIKITGRYKIRNFKNLIFNVSKNTIYVNLTKNLKYSDSRLFILTHHFFSHYLSKNLENINEKNERFMEHVLLSSTLQYISDENNWNLLNEKVIYEGVYGTDNTIYKNNFFSILIKKIAYKLKVFLFKSNL